ncbi:MAG: Asp-tRNA(Asn)/Glu-tRNA(Gln) amidotransferase subunit GatC [Candidatus Omnitrophica bacterium]|nr:Asp-tRNA(Asn)/Glu-tRNA(Gln) amidotransferase subunit GatC [Candidatus Omnitrophota bacterium]
MKKKIDVEYIANLARIRLSKKEIDGFSGQLADIISFIEKLNKADTKETPPTTHPLPLKNVFRADTVKKSLTQEKVLQNAPEKRETSFKVPKIIEES